MRSIFFLKKFINGTKKVINPADAWHQRDGFLNKKLLAEVENISKDG